MRARSRSAKSDTAPAEETTTPQPGKLFSRGLLGYRRAAVEETMTRLGLRVEDLKLQAIELREELLETQHVASETRHDLTRARAELRYWNDRASYVDSEVARARQRAVELEETARDRADQIEADAQERSLQLVDRVCNEANAMLQHAREEAREMFLRFETDVDMSKQKLDRLENVRRDVATTMQAALNQFEDAVRDLDMAAPVKRIAEVLEGPVRTPAPNFGTKKALEAARRFEAAAALTASAALTSPTTITAVSEEMTPLTVVDPTAGDEQATALMNVVPSSVVRIHDADDAFANLTFN